jgi:hypothetical protein
MSGRTQNWRPHRADVDTVRVIMQANWHVKLRQLAL